MRLLALLSAMFLIPAYAYADGRELATKNFRELQSMTAGEVVDSDTVPVYDDSTRTVKKIPATSLFSNPLMQYQTVTASPANAAAISLFTNASVTFRKNFAYSPQMVTMATGDLPLPANTVTTRHRYDNVSMRSITDYVIGTDQEVTRLDVLFGSLFVRPEWGVTVADAV